MAGSRLKAIDVVRFIRVVGSLHHIRFSAVRVIGDGGTLDKDKVQVGGGSNIFQRIGVNDIAVLIRGLDPFSLLLLIGQAAGILDLVSCQLYKGGNGIPVFILRGVIDTDELTTIIGISFLYNRLNCQRLAVGDIGGKLSIHRDGMTAGTAPSRRCSFTATDDRTSMHSSTS